MCSSISLGGQNWHVFIYQTAKINYQVYVGHLYATLRTRREKTLPHQSPPKNILNNGASKGMKNIDDYFRLTDTSIIFVSFQYFT